MLILYIIFIVYLLAVNFYAIMLLKTLKEESFGDEGKMTASDGKLILTALLGGAIAIYITMFIMKYRTKNLLLMVLMPVIGVLNIYLTIAAFRSGISFFVV